MCCSVQSTRWGQAVCPAHLLPPIPSAVSLPTPAWSTSTRAPSRHPCHSASISLARTYSSDGASRTAVRVGPELRLTASLGTYQMLVTSGTFPNSHCIQKFGLTSMVWVPSGGICSPLFSSQWPNSPLMEIFLLGKLWLFCWELQLGLPIHHFPLPFSLCFLLLRSQPQPCLLSETQQATKIARLALLSRSIASNPMILSSLCALCLKAFCSWVLFSTWTAALPNFLYYSWVHLASSAWLAWKMWNSSGASE